MTKDSIQQNAIEHWIAAGKIGTIILPTGVGKTRIGIMAHDQVGGKTLIVTSLGVIVEGWHKELGSREAVVQVINSAHKTKVEVDLLIVDEVHRALSPTFSKVFENVTYKYLLCLTASLPESEERQQLLISKAPIVYSKNIKDVKAVMAPCTVHKVVVNLNKVQKAQYNFFNQKFIAAAIQVAKLKKQTHPATSVFDFAKLHATSTKHNDVTKVCKAYWSYMQLRKRVLYNNDEKIKTIKKILSYPSSTKTIVFCNTIMFAEKVARILDKPVYHSKLTHKERELALSLFKDCIVTVSALNEGIDIVDADTGIAVSSVSSRIINTQQLGRVNRKYGNKVSNFYNLYVEGTPEERWVNSKLKSMEWKQTIV